MPKMRVTVSAVAPEAAASSPVAGCSGAGDARDQVSLPKPAANDLDQDSGPTFREVVLLATVEDGVPVFRRFPDLTAAGRFLLANGASRLLYAERPSTVPTKTWRGK